MDNLLQDFKHAVRSLRHSPGLFVVASLSLALGIAVNVTIFAGVDLILVRPLNYPNVNRMVQIWADNKERGWTRNSVSLADFVDWRDGIKSASISAWSGGSFNLAEGDRPERVNGIRVTPNFFSLFGIAPAQGRFFRQD